MNKKMNRALFNQLSRKDQVKALRAKKLAKRKRVAAAQIKSAQPKQRVVNKKESGIITPKMDRHWNCGCVYRHDSQENSWTRVIVCNTCSAKERLATEAAENMKSIKKVSAKEALKDIDFGKIITGNSHEITGIKKENI